MRGLEFTSPHVIENVKLNFKIEIQIDTSNWNPLHFAIFYKKINVIEAF